MVEVAAAVRAKLGWLPLPEPEPSPFEIIPIDAPRDLEATRAALRAIYGG